MPNPTALQAQIVAAIESNLPATGPGRPYWPFVRVWLLKQPDHVLMSYVDQVRAALAGLP